MTYGWDSSGNQPLPPMNGQVVSPFIQGVLDVRWDDPALLAGNAVHVVVGVNVYRSDVSDRGPYFRINEFPVGGNFYRDRTDNVFVSREVVDWGTSWQFKGNAPNDRRWVFKTMQPIVKKEPNAPFQTVTSANMPSDVTVYIDGVEVPAHDVFGQSGEVTLINLGAFNQATEKFDPALLPSVDSTVEVSYYANRNHVRSGLGTVIHYRLATVVLDATTPSGYRETDLVYCQPVTPMAVETLDYIWREAIRRNHWILQQGGERVKIFIRKQAGIPCTCKLDDRTRTYSNQPSNRCTTCFPPGTLVRTDGGYRPIGAVQVGERVLASDGLYHAVTRTFETAFTGDLVSLLPSVSANPILATPEHPFLVLRGDHQGQHINPCGPKCHKYIFQGDGLGTSGSVRLLPSGRWWARVQVNGVRGRGRKDLGTFETETLAQEAIQAYLQHQAEPGHVLAWDDATNVSKGDWLVAKWAVTERDALEICIPQKFLKNTHLGETRLGPDRFRVDVDFLWMVGLYLAEGCSGSRTINFCLHREETVFQARLVQLFTRWGYHPVVRPHKDPDVLIAVVVVASTTLANWFPKWLGRGCQNKHVPEELMALPVDKTWALIRGIHDGDGSKRDNEITQTSEVLALQVAELLHRVGDQPLVRRQRSNVLTHKGNKRRLAYCVSWGNDTLGRVNRKGRWACQKDVLSQVRNVDHVPYSGMVYNLEVEGDHTYVVQGIVVHNCFGTGFVGGYEGPYDCMIAPDDAEQRISQTPTGRRKEHTYEVWTVPSPIVTMRDFVVKQTNERYSIGAVRRPTNRGNVLQQHFNIAYFDESDIRQRVPINGTANLTWPQTRYGNPYNPPMPTDGSLPIAPPFVSGPDPIATPYPEGPDAQSPMATDKAGWPAEKQPRGRTPVWDNTSK